MRRILRNSSWNLLGYGLPLLVGVAALPLLLRGMGEERFGLLTMVWASLGYFSVFDLGLSRATTKHIAEALGAGNAPLASRVLRAGSALLLAFGGLMAAALGLGAEYLAGTLHSEVPRDELVRTIYLVALSIPVLMLSAGLRGAMEAQERFRLVNLIKIPSTVLVFILPLLILPFTTRLDAITLGLFLGRLVFLFVHIGFSRDLLGLAAMGPEWDDRLIVRKLLGYGSWVFVAVALGGLMSMGYLDRIVLLGMRPAAELAYYATPMEIIMRVLVIPGAVMAAIFPLLSRGLAGHAETLLLCEKLARLLGYVLLPVVVVALALGEEVLAVWLGSEIARQATPVLQLLVIGMWFNAMAYVPYTALQASGQARITAMRHIWQLPFYAPAAYLLILRYGAAGAALTWMVWAITDMILLFWLATRAGVALRPSGRLFTMALVVLPVAYGISFADSSLLRIMATLVLVSAFAGSVWSRGLNSAERREVVVALSLRRRTDSGEPL